MLVLTIAVLLLMPLLYMGSYYALLTHNGPVTLTIAGNQLYRMPNFTVGGTVSKCVYLPAYLLDRKIRRLYWRVDLRDPSATQNEMWIPAIGW